MEKRAPLAFCDTETTGLDPNYHEVWEVGLILRTWNDSGQQNERSYHWFLPIDLGKADPFALKIGNFYNRYPGYAIKNNDLYTTELFEFAESFGKLTQGAHLVGAVPSFDSERLTKLLRANGGCPAFHYHLIDVENLVAGALALEPPYNSDNLSLLALGEERHNALQEVKHTALGDAQWALELYDAVMSGSLKK